MTTTTRAAFAAFLFAGFAAGTLAPSMASAHAVPTEEEKVRLYFSDADSYRQIAPSAPVNLRVELHGEPTSTGTYRAVRVTWEPPHHHLPITYHNRGGKQPGVHPRLGGGTTFRHSFVGYKINHCCPINITRI